MVTRPVAKLDAIRDELAYACATETRVCAMCGAMKPLSAFYAKPPKTGLGVHRTNCQACRDAAKALSAERSRLRDEYEASLIARRAEQEERLASISARIAAGMHPLVANGWTLTTKRCADGS